MLRIGMLTSGGDCQALNVAMRGVAKTLYKNCDDVEIFGFMDGFKGLIRKNYKLLERDDFAGILTKGEQYLELQGLLLNILIFLMRMVMIRYSQ